MKENEQKKKTVKTDGTDYRDRDGSSIAGVNNPAIELPAFNPTPNRAWTAMKNGVDIDTLTPEERRNLYLGRDNIL